MPFEVYDQRIAGFTKNPFVTIQKNGALSLNKAAVNVMGKPEAVELLYDPDEKLIGFKPVPSGNPRSFPLRLQGGNASTYIVSGHSFSKYYDLDTTVARRYGAEVKDDMLVVDLKSESVVVSKRAKAKTGEL